MMKGGQHNKLLILCENSSDVEDLKKNASLAGIQTICTSQDAELSEIILHEGVRVVAVDLVSLNRVRSSLARHESPLVSTVSYIRLVGADFDPQSLPPSQQGDPILRTSCSREELVYAFHLSSEEIFHTQSIRVMFVDDNETGRGFVQAVLDEAGFRSIGFSSAKEAIAALQSEDCPHYDAILTDQVMPEMTGEEFCKWIRAQRNLSDLPVLFFSGNREAANLESIFNSGGTDYIGKDLLANELVPRLLTHILARRYQDAMLRKHVELVNAQRQIEEFLAMCSHDMKNPLSILKLQSDQLRRRYSEDKFLTGRFLERMDNAVSFLHQLIDAVI